MTAPSVSIVVTNFNYSQYLDRCINSCLQQSTEIPYDIVVVDDGSTDQSRAIARRFAGPKVKLIERENGGIEAASNTGLAAAAPLVVRVDADDYLFPDYLETTVGAMTPPEIAFVYPNYVVVDENDCVVSEDHLPPFDVAEVLARGDFLATGTLYRKAAVLSVGGYNESVKNSGLENYELVLKLLRTGCVGRHVAHSLFAYRRHGANISSRRRDAIVQYGRRLFESLELGPYRTNAFHPYKLVLNGE